MKLKKPYIDVTNKWLKHNKIQDIKKYKYGDIFTYKGKKYKFDNHFVKYSFDESEDKFALWLASRINKRITLIPKIEYPLGIRTPDFRIGNKYFDLKTVHGNSKQIIYHKIRNNQTQAENFIINIAKDCDLTYNEIINQVSSLFLSNKNDRNWVKIIGIKFKNKLIVLKKKR